MPARSRFLFCIYAQVLRVSKMLERRVWATQSPLRQLDGQVSADVFEKLESKRATPERLRDMGVREIGQLVSNQRQAAMVAWVAKRRPRLEVEVAARPITRTVLRVTLTVRDARIHPSVLAAYAYVACAHASPCMCPGDRGV